jgi:hypothetical protein
MGVPYSHESALVCPSRIGICIGNMDPDPDPYPRVRMLGNLTFFKTIFKKLYFLHLHGYVQELMKCFKGKSDKKNKFLTFISCVIAKGGPGAVLRRTAGSGLRIRTASLRP